MGKRMANYQAQEGNWLSSVDKKSCGGRAPKNNLYFKDRSRNVYENKQNVDKMPAQLTDIFRNDAK